VTYFRLQLVGRSQHIQPLPTKVNALSRNLTMVELS
jgi:hypothetical protein